MDRDRESYRARRARGAKAKEYGGTRRAKRGEVKNTLRKTIWKNPFVLRCRLTKANLYQHFRLPSSWLLSRYAVP